MYTAKVKEKIKNREVKNDERQQEILYEKHKHYTVQCS